MFTSSISSLLRKRADLVRFNYIIDQLKADAGIYFQDFRAILCGGHTFTLECFPGVQVGYSSQDCVSESPVVNPLAVPSVSSKGKGGPFYFSVK